MAKPKLSVVVATHNRPRLLERAVASVLAQTYDDFELILVDDASAQATGDLIARMMSRDRRIRGLRSDENLGPGGARNLGVDAARGELVAILDDDDMCRPHRFTHQVALLDEHRDVDVVCSSVQWVDHQGETLGIWPGVLERGALPEDPRELFRLLYLQNNKIPNTTLMIRSHRMREFPYPEDIWVGEDWYVCMQMAASGIRMLGIAEPLVLQQRDAAHESLMASKARAFKDQRRVLIRIRQWLAEQELGDIGVSARLAWSNQLTREARFWGGIRGLRFAIGALAHSPSSSEAWACFGQLMSRARKKMSRLGKR